MMNSRLLQKAEPRSGPSPVVKKPGIVRELFTPGDTPKQLFSRQRGDLRLPVICYLHNLNTCGNMKKIIALVLVLTVVSVSAQKKKITAEDVWRDYAFFPAMFPGFNSMNDGAHYTQTEENGDLTK